MESIEGDGFEVIGYTSETTFSQDGLSSSQEYFFSVAAINSVGESPESPAQMIICGVIPNKPPQPTLLSQSDSHVSFTYTPAANQGEPPVLGFIILWNSGSGHQFT